jgi:hypothetical protein
MIIVLYILVFVLDYCNLSIVIVELLQNISNGKQTTTSYGYSISTVVASNGRNKAKVVKKNIELRRRNRFLNVF